MANQFNADPRASLGNDVFLLVARILMASPFLVFGPMKYINMGKMQTYMETGGLPGLLIWLVIPLQIFGGLAIATGLFARIAAVALGVFCIVATCLYHTNWAKSGELAQFTKDFAMAGGMTFLWVYGPGRLSLDALFRRRTPERVAA